MIGPTGPRGLKGEQGDQGVRGRRGIGRLHLEIGFLSLVVASAIGIGVIFFLFEQQRTQLHNQVNKVAALTVQMNRALCLRKDEEQRSITQAKLYLAQHPNGTADFSKALIVKSIHDAEEVFATLADVSCPPPLK